jgi:hypothetical protein
VAQTRTKFHDRPTSMYGRVVDGVLLGQGPRTDKGAKFR